MASVLASAFAERRIPSLDLAGTAVPLRFSNPDAEHWAARRAAGLFDFSFMASFDVSGPQALAFLHRLQTRDLDALSPGRLVYTLMCRHDGTVLNDATVWCLGDGRYRLYTGRRADRTHVAELARVFDVTLTGRSGRDAVLAVQGPESPALLARLLGGLDWAPPACFGHVRAELFGVPVLVGRLGYSGEAGCELIVPASDAARLWDGLVLAGEAFGLTECGFEAANSLRIESGFILYSRELTCDVTPFELGLERLVSSSRADYLGALALQRMRFRSPRRRFVGLLPQRGAERLAAGMRDAPPAACAPAPGTAVVTSACRSPVFGRALALGYVLWEDRHPGTVVQLDQGGVARVARLPFYDPGKQLPRGRWPEEVGAGDFEARRGIGLRGVTRS